MSSSPVTAVLAATLVLPIVAQARMMTLSPGNVVLATYTESAASQLEKLAR